ncbi:MAG: class I adenylate-forming enzyme family protein [Alphaproteobacteria bacterium]|nr:class I adenylate-forming enzyme family protein [Alphaproteobacteria bacterium]
MGAPDRNGNLGYWLGDWPRREPERVALIDLHGGRERTVSYGALEARLDRVASALTHRGLAVGDRVIISVGNRTEFIEAMFGAMRAGLVPVPINTRQGADVLGYIIENCSPRGILAEPAANGAILEIAAAAGVETRIAVDGADGVPPGWTEYESLLAGAAADFVPPALPAEALCFLSYTSGSTGRPKGVPLTHAGQLWWLDAYTRYWPPSPSARNLVAVPLYHKNAMAGAIKPRLHTGGSVVLMPSFLARPFLEAVARHRVTHISGVPTVFTLILEERDLLESLDLSSLELAVVGSAPVHEELEAAMAARLGVPVLQSYGLTEGGPVMLGPPTDGRPVPRGSAGLAWPEGEVKLVDRDGRDHSSDGELWVRNPGVAPGYYALPEVNRERYVDGWLRTGDLFHRDDEGFYFFKGRVDDMFNCGGENIYPKEVENLLLTHPDVVDACVVALAHETKGQAPAALVAVRAGAAVDEAVLRQYCLENGPAYAHPRRVLIQSGPLPLTGARKVDRAGITTRLSAAFGVLGG